MHDGCLSLEEPIPIIDHLIHRITQLPYSGEDPANVSEGKGGELALAKSMKKKFKLEKKKRGYAISPLNNPAVKVSMQILVGKVMRKCHADEVPAPMIVLVTQCAEGFQFNWANYLCGEFLANYRKA